MSRAQPFVHAQVPKPKRGVTMTQSTLAVNINIPLALYQTARPSTDVADWEENERGGEKPLFFSDWVTIKRTAKITGSGADEGPA